MASIRALRGKIHPGRSYGMRESRSVATQPPQDPLLASGVHAPAAGHTRLAIAATESRPTMHHGQHQSLTRKNAIDMSPLDLGLLSPVISSPCAARKAIRRLVSKHSHGLSYHSNHHAHRDAHAWLLR